MVLTHGADVGRLRQVGAALQHQGRSLAQAEASGTQLMALLGEVWQGPDVEHFTQRWGSARALVSEAAERLDAFGRLAIDQATAQDEASGPGGGGAGTGADSRTSDAAAAVAGGALPGRGSRAQDDPDQRAREAPGDTRTEHDDRDANRDPENKPPTDPRPAPPPALGEPVPGTHLPHPPPPPMWAPVDGGAGEHGSEFAGPVDYTVESAARAGALAKSGDWPDAARNLNHYLDNSGDPLTQDVDRMLRECPQLSQAVETQRADMARNAVEDARRRGITEPVTYPLSTPWTGHYIGQGESGNWFYATGGMEYSQTGSITVYPPTEPGGPYRYETTTQTHYRDQYNWDGSKSTKIGPLTVSDAQLAALHRAGIAQEFEMRGTSTPTQTSGEIK